MLTLIWPKSLEPLCELEVAHNVKISPTEKMVKTIINAATVGQSATSFYYPIVNI